MSEWLVVGISGVTNGGKTTLADRLHGIFPGSVLVNQDDYYLPVDDKRHIVVPEVDHINFDVLSSLDMELMQKRITDILSDKGGTSCSNPSTGVRTENSCIKILIVEGFTVFNYKPVGDCCNLKYFLTLNREQCRERRQLRVYEPPDVPGYFEVCVWPMYEKYLQEVQDSVADVRFIDGARDADSIFKEVQEEINREVEKRKSSVHKANF